jgi:hypothetical protein
MHKIGFITAFLYIASLITFLLAVQYDDMFKIFAALSAIFFIAASGALLVMMRMRMEKQNF